MNDFTDYKVVPITRVLCKPFIINIHYAARWPSISYSYGLYLSDDLVGVVTYGTPPSSPLRNGIAGKEFSSDILELNRLVLLNNKKNEASFLVSHSLKLLPKNKIIVSFADISQQHTGYVYQACNFIYCGLSAKRTDWKIKGKEHLHGVTIADEFRGKPNRSLLLKEKYGEDFFLLDRPRKHRYIYVVGDKKYRKAAIANLKYQIQPYPKG
jgi:hypothetical protein